MQFAPCPGGRRFPSAVRQIFVAFTLKLPPARRALYLASLVVALFGIIRLFRSFGSVDFPLGLPFIQVALAMPVWADGTFALILSFLLLNFLVLLEVSRPPRVRIPRPCSTR